MFALFRDYKPLAFFGGIGLVLIGSGLIPGGIVIADFFRTGLILEIPSAILAVGTILAGLISIVMGIILHVIAQRFRELDAQPPDDSGSDPAQRTGQGRAAVLSQPRATGCGAWRVSIIVVNFNGGEKLRKCLQAMLATAGEAEIVVVDNASTDGSAELPSALACADSRHPQRRQCRLCGGLE